MLIYITVYQNCKINTERAKNAATSSNLSVINKPKAVSTHGMKMAALIRSAQLRGLNPDMTYLYSRICYTMYVNVIKLDIEVKSNVTDLTVMFPFFPEWVSKRGSIERKGDTIWLHYNMPLMPSSRNQCQ